MNLINKNIRLSIFGLLFCSFSAMATQNQPEAVMLHLSLFSEAEFETDIEEINDSWSQKKIYTEGQRRRVIRIHADSIESLKSELGKLEDNILISHLWIGGHGNTILDDSGFIVQVGAEIIAFHRLAINKTTAIFASLHNKLVSDPSIFFLSCSIFQGSHHDSRAKANLVLEVLNRRSGRVFGHNDQTTTIAYLTYNTQEFWFPVLEGMQILFHLVSRGEYRREPVKIDGWVLRHTDVLRYNLYGFTKTVGSLLGSFLLSLVPLDRVFATSKPLPMGKVVSVKRGQAKVRDVSGFDYFYNEF